MGNGKLWAVTFVFAVTIPRFSFAEDKVPQFSKSILMHQYGDGDREAQYLSGILVDRPEGIPLGFKIKGSELNFGDKKGFYTFTHLDGYYARKGSEKRDGQASAVLETYDPKTGRIDSVLSYIYRIDKSGRLLGGALESSYRIFKKGSDYYIENLENGNKSTRALNFDGNPPRLSDKDGLRRALAKNPKEGEIFFLQRWDFAYAPPILVKERYKVLKVVEDGLEHRAVELEQLSKNDTKISRRILRVGENGSAVYSNEAYHNNDYNLSEAMYGDQEIPLLDGAEFFKTANEESKNSFDLSVKDLQANELRFVLKKPIPLSVSRMAGENTANQIQRLMNLMAQSVDKEYKFQESKKFTEELFKYPNYSLTENGDILVDLRKGHYKPSKASVTPEEISMPDDAKIPESWIRYLRKKMEKAVTDEKKAEVLAAFVTGKIKGIDSAANQTIEEILDLRGGLCRDYSSLSAALFRRLGIPARLVVGMYIAKAINGGVERHPHVWIEIHSHGDWIPIEPQIGTVVASSSSYFPIYHAPGYASGPEQPRWSDFFNYDWKPYAEVEGPTPAPVSEKKQQDTAH